MRARRASSVQTPIDSSWRACGPTTQHNRSTFPNTSPPTSSLHFHNSPVIANMIAARTSALRALPTLRAATATPRFAAPTASRSITNLAKKQYTAHGHARGKGRDGHAMLIGDQVGLEVKLGLPKELGGNGAGNNPEELFALAYSSCFLSALQLVARNAKEQLPSDTNVDALVSRRVAGHVLYHVQAKLRFADCLLCSSRNPLGPHRPPRGIRGIRNRRRLDGQV